MRRSLVREGMLRPPAEFRRLGPDRYRDSYQGRKSAHNSTGNAGRSVNRTKYAPMNFGVQPTQLRTRRLLFDL